MGLNATQIAKLTGISRQTVNHYLTAIRHRIVKLCQQESLPLVGQIEVDESYFGARRVKGKTVVFGLLKRQGKVYTEIVPDYTAATLQSIILGKTDIDSVIHSDG